MISVSSHNLMIKESILFFRSHLFILLSLNKSGHSLDNSPNWLFGSLMSMFGSQRKKGHGENVSVVDGGDAKPSEMTAKYLYTAIMQVWKARDFSRMVVAVS